MKRSIDLANRLEQVLLNGLWIANTNFNEQLEHIDWVEATQKIGNLNTIAALTYHVDYYLSGILNVLKGGNLEISDRYSFDLPLITSEKEWKILVNNFLANAKTFVSEVAKIPDTKLDDSFVDEKYGSYLRNMEGVIEHCYYHLGQIVLIRKLLSE